MKKLEVKKLKVATIVGTRPEIIRLSRIMALLDQHCDHVIVHTTTSSTKSFLRISAFASPTTFSRLLA